MGTPRSTQFHWWNSYYSTSEIVFSVLLVSSFVEHEFCIIPLITRAKYYACLWRYRTLELYFLPRANCRIWLKETSWSGLVIRWLHVWKAKSATKEEYLNSYSKDDALGVNHFRWNLCSCLGRKLLPPPSSLFLQSLTLFGRIAKRDLSMLWIIVCIACPVPNSCSINASLFNLILLLLTNYFVFCQPCLTITTAATATATWSSLQHELWGNKQIIASSAISLLCSRIHACAAYQIVNKRNRGRIYIQYRTSYY
jgi:hypothetical protein